MTRRRIVIAVLILAGVALGWWRFGTHNAPAGQPPLVTLDARSVATLRDDFNSASGQLRVILLLSPT